MTINCADQAEHSRLVNKDRGQFYQRICCSALAPTQFLFYLYLEQVMKASFLSSHPPTHHKAHGLHHKLNSCLAFNCLPLAAVYCQFGHNMAFV